MRFLSVLISAAIWSSCSFAYTQFAQAEVDERQAAAKALREAGQDLADTATPLKGLKSVILAVTYSKDYKPARPNHVEEELLKASTIKLRAAGIRVQTETENIKMMNARMQAALNWDGRAPLNAPEPEDAPMLVQSISAFKWINDTTIVTTNTYLSEKGFLARAPRAKRLVTSWTVFDINTDVVDNPDLQMHCLKVTNDQLDDFIRDWTRQNASDMQPRS